MPEEVSRTIQIGEQKVVLSEPRIADKPRIRALLSSVSDHDLLCVDIRDLDESSIETWIDDQAKGRCGAVVARSGGSVIGISSIHFSSDRRTRHVGEIRFLVANAARGNGLGRILLQQSFLWALEHDLEKISVCMTLDQMGARVALSELGFETEALLKDHVRDCGGDYCDLMVMSCNIAGATARLMSYR